jgi:catechol 2,3-dioxygenase-like lactoylglutathione lyase family enzyme
MDRIDKLLTLFERREISRRDLLAALALAGAGAGLGASELAVRARTLNHVSLGVTDLGRSTEFYDRLLHLPVRDRGGNYCEYRLENGFLGLYQEPGMRRGLDHVAIGIAGYDAKTVLRSVHQAVPKATAEMQNEDQIFVTDPDGARIQLCGVDYKL